VQQSGYTEVVILTISHGLAASGEAVSLNATSPSGITVGFAPSSPVQVPATKALNVTLILTASATAPIGNTTITVHGVSGTNAQTASFTLSVVQYRVVMIHNTFSPMVLNVTAGTTVYWQDLDGPAAGCAGGASTGTGAHSVVFTTLPGASSSTINQFGIYKYTFATAGSYFYYSSLDTDHLMNGTINVVPVTGGGGGMMPVSMPAFSYFKATGAHPAGQVSTTTSTTVANPVYTAAATSPFAAAGLAFAGLAFLNAHSSVLTGLEFGAVLAVLLGIAALGFAVAMAATGKRRFAILGVGITEPLSPSDSTR